MELAILIDNTGFSEVNFSIFRSIGKIDKEVSVYYGESRSDITNDVFQTFDISELDNHPVDIAIATSMSTAHALSEKSGIRKRILYMWDIGFLLYPFDFDAVHDILSSLEVVTRSQTHAEILRSTMCIDSYIIPNFDLEQITKIVR